MKYGFTGETKEYNGITLKRIIALKDFSGIKKDDLGGWIEKESNLSHSGNAWVYGEAMVFDHAKVFDSALVFDSAMVYGGARVYGYAIVYGRGRVYGDAIATKEVTDLIGLKYNVTITDNYMCIGCENHPISYWMSLTKKDIIKMDGKDSFAFYKIWNKPLRKLIKNR